MRLQKTVILAYTDIGAAGSRAVLVLNKATHESFTIDSLGSVKSASIPNDTHQVNDSSQFQPFVVLNCTNKQVSCVVINALIPGTKCHLVADYVIELCIQSAVEKLVILSVLHLDKSFYTSDAVYENCLSASKLTAFPSLPDSTPIHDPFLNTLIQLVKVECITTSVLVMPGYRTREGRVDDTTVEAVLQFHKILEKIFGLKFDLNICKNLMYRGRNEADDDMASMIYL